MSRIYVTRDDDNLVFSTGPVTSESEVETRLSRKTFLAFAKWLKKHIQEEDRGSDQR